MKTTEKYLQLLQAFPPRPITSDANLKETQSVINQLLDKPDLTAEEEDYLDVLGTLVYEYEQQQEEIIPDIYGVELLKALISEYDLKQKDLISIFKTESIVSDVLNAKRQLTVRHIQELAEFFNLSPAVFFPVDLSRNLMTA
jgi:HTH-type transcriptional regulator/antitoxin HigA